MTHVSGAIANVLTFTFTFIVLLKLVTDKKHRAASLRQQSYLSTVVSCVRLSWQSVSL